MAVRNHVYRGALRAVGRFVGAGVKKDSGPYRFPAHDCASRFHAGITPLDYQCSMENIALNDSGAI
jgi:hypothetical protein